MRLGLPTSVQRAANKFIYLFIYLFISATIIKWCNVFDVALSLSLYELLRGS